VFFIIIFKLFVQGFTGHHEDEHHHMTPEEEHLMGLFMDDGATDEGEEVKTNDLPKDLFEDFLPKWHANNRLTIDLMRLLRTTYLDMESKEIGLQVIKHLAMYEVGGLKFNVNFKFQIWILFFTCQTIIEYFYFYLFCD
jgi:hypothetical protein